MSKAGLIALIGRPNAGKSTLLNRLVGQAVSIVSDKPQTTRYRILGVRTTSDCQMVFVDTPGVHRPGHRLNERMMEAVYEALREVHLILHMVDMSERFGKGEKYVGDMVQQAQKPTLLLLNKVDLINKGRILPVLDFYQQEHDYLEMIPISATQGDNTEVLLEKIAENLPEGDFLYPSEYVTDQLEKSMVGERIREKVLQNTRQELPYASAVLLEEFEEEERDDGFVRITASIIVEKPGQKRIVIGRGGQMIKTIGTRSRKDIEKLLGVRKVYLELQVRVVPNWRNMENLLDRLG